MRFVDTIEGLNEVFETDIPKNSVVLVTGAAGTLKSGFTFQVLSNYLEQKDEYGLYITLEQSKENHLQNMDSMGIALSNRLHISDFSDYRVLYDDFSDDLLSILEENILQFKKNIGEKCTCIAIDSLGALYSLLDVEPRDLRKSMYKMLETFRREKFTTFLILEEEKLSGMADPSTGMEGYLADGIIELGLQLKGNVANRYLRVRKMRASSHSMEPWILTVSDKGLKVYKGNF
ncbi:RAD55 family ATPase [Methanolobus profundi]|uniref:RecA-superfamily ATPase, KaiC/GvpD/RAD55 family n=1 Tax=Methanolobus profundi TaxID=487685 RepID=A0A1I4NKP6_9EURY|nr:ATPase domain-containing protein [Methanolobus profundi]SFM16021.1 RecA-superfamily ATPase, KaiC/GvpD/RAD55 family [Methanolobus profundi]